MPTLPVIGIGASAGGVEAMRTLFAGLPDDLPAAVLVVLHMPAHSPSRLDGVLTAVTRLPVEIARDGARLQPGHVYVASPDRHLLVEGQRLRLSRGPKECRVRPAIDVLFRSLAIGCGPMAAGVVLSGMLDDGTAGLWSLKEHGGRTLVQDPADAMHPSMPESAIEHVAVDTVASAGELARELAAWAHQAASSPASAPPALEGHKVESTIASEANALQKGVLDLGVLSKFTCPDCHGVLVEIQEGRVVRFRCHTGHAFSIKTLLAEVNSAIDNGLWATLRAIEERLLLLRQLGELARQRGDVQEAERCEREADHLGKPIKAMRALVLDPHLFGQ
jgi:two-component system chemotaxis response regulator CheB